MQAISDIPLVNSYAAIYFGFTTRLIELFRLFDFKYKGFSYDYFVEHSQNSHQLNLLLDDNYDTEDFEDYVNSTYLHNYEIKIFGVNGGTSIANEQFVVGFNVSNLLTSDDGKMNEIKSVISQLTQYRDVFMNNVKNLQINIGPVEQVLRFNPKIKPCVDDEQIYCTHDLLYSDVVVEPGLMIF